MAKIHRLPNGYKVLVTTKKKQIKQLLKSIEHLKDVGGYKQTFETKVSALGMHLSLSKRYTDTNGNFRIAFDSGIISSEIIIDKATGHWNLCDTCMVFVDNSDDYIESYKW